MKTLKFISVFVLCLVFSNQVSAQYKYFTGGTLSFLSSGVKDVDERTTTYSVMPYLGYNMSDNLVLGLGAGISGESYDNDKETMFNLMPFVRFRHTPNEKMGVYLQADATVGFGNIEVNSIKNKRSSFEIGVRPGIDYALSDRWFITANYGFLGFSTATTKPDGGGDGTTANVFGLALDPATLGFSLNYAF